MSSAATKKKHVAREIEEELILPSESQMIVRVVSGKGNNLHEVETASGETFLVSMPTKYRKNVWIKRGDYVICIPIEEGDKVKGEIIHVLYKDNIRYIQQNNLWPVEFSKTCIPQSKDSGGMHGIDSDMLPPSESEDSDVENGTPAHQNGYFNPNHRHLRVVQKESGSESSGDECPVLE